MADKPTSTNQGLNLATINTTHAGMTSGPTDVCKVPPKNDPAPFPNTAPVDRNPVGMTSQRTVVDNKQIITIRARFGNPSDDAHAGKSGGVKTGSYQGWAMVTNGSQDLRTEGVSTGRHTDDTIQNNGNTTGMLRDRNQSLDAINAEKAKLKRCTLVKVDFQEDDSPRKVTTADRGLYLEIVEGSTITVTAHRKNMAAATAKNPQPDPACTIPAAGWAKTRFQVVFAGKLWKITPPNLVKSDTKDNVDVYKLGEDWVGQKSGQKGKSPEQKGGEDADRRAATAARSTGTMADRSGRVGNVVAPPPNPGRRAALGLPAGPVVGGRQGDVYATKAEFTAAKGAAQQAAAQQTRDTIAARQAAFDKGARTDKKVITGIKAFLDLWKTLVPGTITVTSAACTGAYVGQVKVYPEGAFEYDPIELFETFCAPFANFMSGLKGVLDGLSAATGFEWDIGVLNKSLRGTNRGKAERPVLKIQWEYKELTEDSKEPGGPKMNQVGLAFGVLFGIEKLVFARCDLTVSLFVIAGGPGVGGVAKKILEWCGIEFELGVAMELSVGVSGFIGRDEYHVKQACDVDTTILALISIYLIARAGSFGYAKADVTFAFSLKLKEVRYGQGVRPPIEILVADQKFTITFQATIQANVRGLRDPRKFPDAPHNLITPVTWPDKWKSLF